MDRRNFLQSALYAAPLFTAGRLFAAPMSGPRLLLVFLRGAYDASNILVPVSSDFYYSVRPNLAIAKNAALPLETDWGLHPALKDCIYPLWQQKEIAFVPFAGTVDTSRSHFETQDTIELGQPLPSEKGAGSRDYQSGFMSRAAQVLAGSTPISFTNQLPLTFRGGAPVPNIAPNFAGKPAIAGRNADLIQAMYQGQDLAPAVSEGFAVQTEVYDTISGEMMAANRNAVTTRGFEQAAQRIGALMQDKFNLGFHKLQTRYEKAIAVCLERPVLVVAVFSLFVVCSFALYPVLGKAFFPRTDPGQFVVNVKVPAAQRFFNVVPRIGNLVR